jgi:hypothetical protein
MTAATVGPMGGARVATVNILWHMNRAEGGIPEKLRTMEPTKRQRAAIERIQAELGSIGPSLPGSVVVRTGRCGKPACKCHGDPPRLHGPFRSWTRKIAGKTVTRLLTEDQLDEYQAYFDNHKRLKELVHDLEDLSLTIVDRDPRWRSR